jgi:hypothetical protein
MSRRRPRHFSAFPLRIAKHRSARGCAGPAARFADTIVKMNGVGTARAARVSCSAQSTRFGSFHLGSALRYRQCGAGDAGHPRRGFVNVDV